MSANEVMMGLQELSHDELNLFREWIQLLKADRTQALHILETAVHQAETKNSPSHESM